MGDRWVSECGKEPVRNVDKKGMYGMLQHSPPSKYIPRGVNITECGG
jgi:hypothetical protein